MIAHEYMLSQTVPETMVEFVRCKCKKSCSTNRCSCRKANLSCTDACLCNENDDCVNCETFSSNDVNVFEDSDDIY